MSRYSFVKISPTVSDIIVLVNSLVCGSPVLSSFKKDFSMKNTRKQSGNTSTVLLLLLGLFLAFSGSIWGLKEVETGLSDLKRTYDAQSAQTSLSKVQGAQNVAPLLGKFSSTLDIKGYEVEVLTEFSAGGRVTRSVQHRTLDWKSEGQFVQTGNEVSYALVTGDAELFPEGPEVFAVTDSGVLYSAFLKTNLVDATTLPEVPSETGLAEMFEEDSTRGLIARMVLGLIGIFGTFLIVTFVLRNRSR